MSNRDETPERLEADARLEFGQSTRRSFLSRIGMASLYYAPDKIFGLKGNPVPVPAPKPALDEAAAHRLWELSEQITGVQWPLEVTPQMALRS